ncbi:hypothetical protein [Actinoplanes sp. NPDC089786]|uniref:hypothetical protein n=1 Tax=Actinoplanes sp. NPDC089786 TaxID=3155185 RepID=UPI0034453D4E
MTPARPMVARTFAASVAALGVAGIIAAPASATVVLAAPAPAGGCAQPERYAAQSGAELLKISKLTVRSNGKPGDGRGRHMDAHGDRAGRTPSPGTLRTPVGDAPTPGPGTTAGSSADAGPAGGDRGKPRPSGGSLLGNLGGAVGLGSGGPGGGQGGGQGGGLGGGQGGGAPADPGPREVTVRGLHVGEAKSAMIGLAGPNAAALTRMVNSAEQSRATSPLVQQAPPNRKARKQETPAAEAGPILMDVGSLATDATWRSGMACGKAYGDITRAAATLGAAQVSGSGSSALVAVPETAQSVSTTALERTAQGARTVSHARLSATAFELLDGAVQIEVLRSPSLRTTMSTVEGGDVRYVPAAIRITGDGIKTTKLDAAGDSIELTFSERQTESLRLPDLGTRTVGDLPLPTIPGLPQLPAGEPESAPSPGPGTSVKISLGRVRQATEGRAIAAKASAITVGITQGGPADDGYGRNADVALDLAIGALESAAVAPEPAHGDVESAYAGTGGGLPVTGPGASVMVVIGGALLASGVVAVLLGRRRRRFEA